MFGNGLGSTIGHHDEMRRLESQDPTTRGPQLVNVDRFYVPSDEEVARELKRREAAKKAGKLFGLALVLFFPFTLDAETDPLMRVTSYCPNECCCAPYADGITASGVPAKGKIVAADKRYRFGTVMHVPGYGRATVQDRGGAIRGNRIDVLHATHSEALAWGVRFLRVEIENR